MALAVAPMESHPSLHFPRPYADKLKPSLVREQQPALETSRDAAIKSASDNKKSDGDGGDFPDLTQAEKDTTRDLEERSEVSCDLSAGQIDKGACSAGQISLLASASEEEALDYLDFLDEEDKWVKQVRLLEADSFDSDASDGCSQLVTEEAENEDIQGSGEEKSDGDESEDDEDREYWAKTLERNIKEQKSVNERLLSAGGRPLFSISQFCAINTNPNAYRDLLLPWQRDDWWPCEDVEWLHILEQQLSSWQYFRNWQRINRTSEDETPSTAQEERLMTIYREVWGMDFGVYAEKVRQRLARHGCVLQSLDLRETVDDQDALATWIEYACFECRSAESAKRSVMLQKSKQKKELQLIAEPYANGWAGRVLSKSQKDALTKSGCIMKYTSVDEHDIRDAERRYEGKLRIKNWAISQIPVVAAELGQPSPIVGPPELDVNLEDSPKMHIATNPSRKRNIDEMNGEAFADHNAHGPAKSARRDPDIASEKDTGIRRRRNPVRFDDDVAILELEE